MGLTECAASAATPRRLRWDTLQVVLTLLVFMQVWRIQDLFPAIAIPGLPVLGTLAVLFLLVLDQDPRRRLDMLKSPSSGLRLRYSCSPPSRFRAASTPDTARSSWSRTTCGASR